MKIAGLPEDDQNVVAIDFKLSELDEIEQASRKNHSSQTPSSGAPPKILLN